MADDGLDGFRTPGRCEICKEFCQRREPHHIRTQGSGGPDHPWNVLGICPAFAGGECHTRLHFGGLTIKGRRMLKEDLFELVSAREGVPVSVIIAEVNRLVREPKEKTVKRPRKKPKPRPANPPCKQCERPVRTAKGRAWPAVAWCFRCRKERKVR